MIVSIEDVLFMDSDNLVFTEGVDEYLEKYRLSKEIMPVNILLVKDFKFYAGEGRHRTYMYYHRLGLRSMEVCVIPQYKLNVFHLQGLRDGCVGIGDLVEASLE